MAGVVLFVMMWLYWFVQVAACLAVTSYFSGAELWSDDFHEVR